MISERMYIEELKKELPWRDIRSIEKFLCTYQIRLFSFSGSKIRFVLRDEFESQMKKIYNSIPLDRATNKTFSQYNEGEEYEPRGEYEREALSIFTTL